MLDPTRPSFSPRRKWSIAFNVVLATIAVVLIVLGVNYISSRFLYKRYYLGSQTRIDLSPRTISLLRSLTNQVDVTIYYNKEDPLYKDISALLKEYQARTRQLSVKTVDYYLDPGEAQEIKLKYNLGSATNRDFVIFDCNGRRKFVDGGRLTDYKYDVAPSTNRDDPRLNINRKRIAFSGELHFSSALFAVTQEKPLKAYFLVSHGERSPNDTSDIEGYSKLADIFHRNYVATDTLNGLLSTNPVPSDCNLLVIAGPRQKFEPAELSKISDYLDQGGRLFALFDVYSTNFQTGLESILAKWNLRVTHSTVRDPDYAIGDGSAFSVSGLARHEITEPLLGQSLEIALPRPIERIKAPSATSAEQLQVAELAYSSTNSLLADNPSGSPHPYPLMAAVEKSAAKGVATERGNTRMLVTGDSLFLDNQIIDYRVNQDFADSAINWLLDRTELLAGIGSRPVKEYRLLMSSKQVAEVKGVLLGAIPGGILLFGGLVWLRRRK